MTGSHVRTVPPKMVALRSCAHDRMVVGAPRAFAGTTGSVTGTVARVGGGPIAGARVTAISPSQTLTVTTDASGRFSMLSLAPDTYTISVSKDRLRTFHDHRHFGLCRPSADAAASASGVAANDRASDGALLDGRRQIGNDDRRVFGQCDRDGGRGRPRRRRQLNNAYSAIAAVPGAFVPPNQQGWDQTVYIRGGNYDQIGYEFDGVPVNRSFDNYPGGTAGTLGQQELQVYTGGGKAGSSASGWPASSTKSSRPEPSPDTRRWTRASARRHTITTFSLKSGAPRPTACSLITSASADTTRISATSTNSTVRISATSGAILRSRYNTANLYFGGVFPTCVHHRPAGERLVRRTKLIAGVQPVRV